VPAEPDDEYDEPPADCASVDAVVVSDAASVSLTGGLLGSLLDDSLLPPDDELEPLEPLEPLDAVPGAWPV
jgi:hypothetical protein